MRRTPSSRYGSHQHDLESLIESACSDNALAPVLETSRINPLESGCRPGPFAATARGVNAISTSLPLGNRTTAPLKSPLKSASDLGGSLRFSSEESKRHPQKIQGL